MWSKMDQQGINQRIVVVQWQSVSHHGQFRVQRPGIYSEYDLR